MVIHGCWQNIQIIVLAQIYFLQEDLKMNIGVTEISPREVQRKAEKCFKDGYYCCEALVSTIRDEFKLDVPKEVVAMASGMAVGAGKSGCVCGAFNGFLVAKLNIQPMEEFLHLECSSAVPNRMDRPTRRVSNVWSLRTSFMTGSRRQMVKMQSAAEFLQRNSIWDRVNTKNSVSILQDFVHGR